MNEDQLIQELKKLRRRFFRPRVRESYVCEVAAPASEEQLGETERRLGFPLPKLLRRIYSEVGNGGFGPGYGLTGCIGGYRDAQEETIVEGYLGRRERDPKDAAWQWPEKLVPLFSWGGAVYTCGDFGPEDCPLIEFDPHRYRGAKPLSKALHSHGMNLQEFLSRWISGEDVMLQD